MKLFSPWGSLTLIGIHGESHEYLLVLPEPTKEEIIRLCLYHTMFINFESCMYPKQNNHLNSCFLLLKFLLMGFLLLLIQYSLLIESSSRFKEFSLGRKVVGYSLIRKNREINRKEHLLSLFVILCHSISPTLLFAAISCHSLSLVITHLYLYKRSWKRLTFIK